MSDENKMLNIFDDFWEKYRSEVNKSLENVQIPIRDRADICEKHGNIEYSFGGYHNWKCEESRIIWNTIMEDNFCWESGIYNVWEEIFENYKEHIIEDKDLGCLDQTLFYEIPSEDEEWDENEKFIEQLDEILMVLYVGEKISRMNYFNS